MKSDYFQHGFDSMINFDFQDQAKQALECYANIDDTYRKMAEDVVNNAAFISKLPKKECVTKNLAIGNNAVKKGADFLKESYSCNETDIAHFVQNEMAVTVEDILARRTRLLLLDADAAIAAAPAVAKAAMESGVAKNPIDHPHGGGEGKTSGGRHSVSR